MKLSNKIPIIVGITVVAVLAYLLWSSPNEKPGTTSMGNEQVHEITHAHGLVVSVENSNILYIPTHHGLVSLTNEKEMYQVGNVRDDLMGFSLHPSNPNIFFSSGHPARGGNSGFQKSEDKGITWKKVSNGVSGPVDFHAMTVSPANPDLIYGWYQGGIQRSTDGGKNWEVVSGEVLAIQLAADPKDENIVYASTPNGKGVLISRDKGVTWSSLSQELEDGQVATIAIDPNDINTMFVFSEKLGGLGKSTDAGKTWQKVSTNFNGETVLYIAFDNKKPEAIYLLTHKNTLYKSTDKGVTWIQINLQHQT